MNISNLHHLLQAMQYMELLPESQRPVSGTVGALARRRRLLTQLPAYDQDPMKCQSLASEEEVNYCDVISFLHMIINNLSSML